MSGGQLLPEPDGEDEPLRNRRWIAKVERTKPMFEVFGFALTTVTWTSLCIAVSIIFIQGALRPYIPLLQDEGWVGHLAYDALGIIFLVLSVLSSFVLVAGLWAIMAAFKADVEAGRVAAPGFFKGIGGTVLLYVTGIYFIGLNIVLALQILLALGRIAMPGA